jgi:hypothetical protein
MWQCEANLWGRQKRQPSPERFGLPTAATNTHVMNRDFGTSPLKGHLPDGQTSLSLIAWRRNE